jgi:hypothetical protein
MKAKELSILMLMVFPHATTWGFLLGNRFMGYAGLSLTLMGVAWYLYVSLNQ